MREAQRNATLGMGSSQKLLEGSEVEGGGFLRQESWDPCALLKAVKMAWMLTTENSRCESYKKEGLLSPPKHAVEHICKAPENTDSKTT